MTERTCPYCHNEYTPLKGKWRKECCERKECMRQHVRWREQREKQVNGEYRARQRANFKSIRRELTSNGKVCCRCHKRPVAPWLTMTCETCFHKNSEISDEMVGLSWGGYQHEAAW